MDDSELTILAKRIYTKHRRALDFIFEQRPDLQNQVGEFLKSMIRKREDLVLDHCTKSYVRFALSSWDSTDVLKRSEGWTPSGHLLLFEFRNFPEKLQLALVIGPGSQETRKILFEIALKSSGLFKPSAKTLYPKWAQIWSRAFLGRKDIEDADWDNITSKIEKTWSHFIENDLPRISRSIGEALDQ